MHRESGIVNITNVKRISLTKNVWRNIMKNESKIYKKSCPICEKDQIYKNEFELKRATRKNTNCNSCAQKKCQGGEKNGMFGRKHSEETKRKIREKRANQIFTEESFKKMSETHKKRLSEYNHWDGRKHKPETRRKMRKSAINYVEAVKFNGGQMKPNYNLNSIPILEQKATELGINDLQHAENGGEFYIKELGYWVDGYSKETNTVIEYYEKRHRYRKFKDILRQKEITNLLKCKFIIIKE